MGILICVSVILTAFIDRNSSYDFDTGVIMGGSIAILMTIEVYLLADIIGEPKPSAIDVYRGNTELEITSVNGTPIDSVVVFKEKQIMKDNVTINIYGGNNQVIPDVKEVEQHIYTEDGKIEIINKFKVK